MSSRSQQVFVAVLVKEGWPCRPFGVTVKARILRRSGSGFGSTVFFIGAGSQSRHDKVFLNVGRTLRAARNYGKHPLGRAGMPGPTA